MRLSGRHYDDLSTFEIVSLACDCYLCFTVDYLDQLVRETCALWEPGWVTFNWRGYTYNEEMRGQALLQLSQIGLQFDESKSQNPFAYYTAAITNSFTRILNLEKKNQNIRDDILEINGLNPSWTRQNAGKSDAHSSGPVVTTYEE